MNSPDQTYRRLRQTPFEEVVPTIRKIVDRFYQSQITARECSDQMNDFRSQHGWTEKEFNDEYEKRYIRK